MIDITRYVFIVSLSFTDSLLIVCYSRLHSWDVDLSRPTDPIETNGTVRPLGVTKVKSAIAESVGCHWKPTAINQVSARLHDDIGVRGPGNEKLKSVCMNAKTGASVQHHGIRQ